MGILMLLQCFLDENINLRHALLNYQKYNCIALTEIIINNLIITIADN